MRSINPATGEVLATIADHANGEVDRRLTRAVTAFREWRERHVVDRAAVLAAIAAQLDREQEDLARLMTAEVGKTLQAARDEVAKCAGACRYYAEHGPSFVRATPVSTDAEHYGEARYVPLGAVLAVMPWNFPLWQVVRFAAPAIMAGNVGLLKHASNVPQCALALESVIRRAGAPDGVFQVLLVGGDRVARLIADDRVAAVTLTGSEAAGRSVAGAAGQALKKSVLELGGSDPFIVLDSADVRSASATAVTARCINNGQSCIAAKRFIVHRDVADEFRERFVQGMREQVVGDPMDPTTTIGPLAMPQIVNDLEQQIEQSLSAGARAVLRGGRRPHTAGNWYDPTVLDHIPKSARAYREEVFGPAGSIFVVDSMDDAIRVANDTPFGLGASVWTTDPGEAEACAARIESGTVFINALVASDARFPFGGVKASGYGRELGIWGLREFVNVQTVRRWHLSSPD